MYLVSLRPFSFWRRSFSRSLRRSLKARGSRGWRECAGSGARSSTSIPSWLIAEISTGTPALVTAVPKINAARNAEEYAAAVQTMLDALGDPVTRILSKGKEAPALQGRAERQPVFLMTKDGILILTVNRYADLSDLDGAQKRMEAAIKQLTKARPAIFDFRAVAPPSADVQGYLSYVFAASGIAAKMTSKEVHGRVQSPGIARGAQKEIPVNYTPSPISRSYIVLKNG